MRYPSISLRFRHLASTLMATALLGCAPAEPDTEPRNVVASTLLTDTPMPSLSAPRLLGKSNRGALGPVWIGAGEVVHEVPRILHGLARVEKPGFPVYDPSTAAWYASANGTIVAIGQDTLTVVADGVQGLDLDVRAQSGIAVSREPNNTIVLHRFDAPLEAKVLFSGPGFFHPRLSPRADSVIVSEARPEDTRIWLSPLEGTPRELTIGQDPAWHPDEHRIVFVRVQHDGHTLVSSDVWLMDLTTGEERLVGRAPVPALRPSISPDGSLLAFADGRNGNAYLARFDDPFVTGGK